MDMRKNSAGEKAVKARLCRIAVIFLALRALCLTAQLPSTARPLVDKFVLDDTIQPVAASELDRALSRAQQDGAAALLIELNTPGGMLDTTRAMVGSILNARIPVILYVAPSGARAGSAGFFLLEAADIAAMAPGTNAGAAHPVMEFGGQPDATMNEKIVNDTEAFLRSYVTKRGRNAEAAQAAVHASHSYTAQEALDQHLIDLVANDEQQLLNQLEGRAITRMDGSSLTLHLTGARIVEVRSTLRDELLGWLINPNIALLCLLAGALLIYLEFNTPGTIVPGALGTLLLLLGIFALNLLPIRYTAVLLIVAAVALLLLEAKFGGHGVLAIAGIVCLTFGTLTLVAAPVPEMAISPWVAFAVSAAFGLITVLLLRLAVKARRMKTRLGADALVGCKATALEEILPPGQTPEGHVLVEGELWRAVSPEPLAKGAQLRVLRHDGYVLCVAAEEKPSS
jgi:membrane-bound serine protease (ClpP class)